MLLPTPQVKLGACMEIAEIAVSVQPGAYNMNGHVIALR
jgi:hypothetical protein